MIEIRKVLHPYLLALHSRVYFQRAPDTAQMPYLTYTFANIRGEGEGRQILTLDIDGWDNKEDSTGLENLMSGIEAGLDRHVLAGTGIVAAFYLENKMPVLEDDRKIQRRRYIFQGRIYKRS